MAVLFLFLLLLKAISVRSPLVTHQCFEQQNSSFSTLSLTNLPCEIHVFFLKWPFKMLEMSLHLISPTLTPLLENQVKKLLFLSPSFIFFFFFIGSHCFCTAFRALMPFLIVYTCSLHLFLLRFPFFLSPIAFIVSNGNTSSSLCKPHIWFLLFHILNT